jgi:threonine synthase
VGWEGLMEDFRANDSDGMEGQLSVSIESAHPAKFPEEIKEILGKEISLPPSLRGLEDKKEQYDVLENDYDKFKSYLKDRYL